MIPFNVPAVTGKELLYINDVLSKKKFSGDGFFTKTCQSWLEERFSSKKAILITSCTHALEMSALLAEIEEGDEVIMPSFTFPSTASAFVLRNAKIVFVDIRPDTMNIDEQLIETAITPRTKAIVVVHYAGISCEMKPIMDLADKYQILVIEDAAQGVMSTYQGKSLGTIGHLGCYSFHETKNYQCGEGGALLVNDQKLIERAEIIREKGTNRAKFFRGEIDKYSWVDVGSSYLPSELNAAFLYAQLEHADEINRDRLKSWNSYYQRLKPLKDDGLIELPVKPETCQHNAHLFFIKTKDRQERERLIAFLKKSGVMTVFHYVPLHSSKAGMRFGRFHGEDRWTTRESERLLRLPMYFGLNEGDIEKIVMSIHRFYDMV
jgi:dTDP-4-amino-4,6-dideoxygalactose transaminase